MSTETSGRLRWEPGEDGILFGYVGTLKTQAFVICPPGSPGEFWMISTPFPLGQPRYVGSEGEARKAAERWLEEFVTSLGAVFPDEDVEPPTGVLMVCIACRKPVYQQPGWTAAGPGTATRLWSHESPGDWQACPRYGSGVPVEAVPAPAGEE